MKRHHLDIPLRTPKDKIHYRQKYPDTEPTAHSSLHIYRQESNSLSAVYKFIA
jgi:hypothetical protein